MNLLVSTDTLVSQVHFLPEWNAYDIAYRAVMVTVSDLAAMAAQPRWATLALTLPELNEHWLTDFSRGLQAALQQCNMILVGGDTTQGPLSITLTVFGVAPKDKELRRSGAQPGDIIFVSGQLGAAALAVKLLHDQNVLPKDRAELMKHLLHPKPRIDLLEFLRLNATSAIDISDGLSADLDHICQASNVGACLNQQAIPVHPLLKKYLQQEAVDLALAGGDDYELCFTIAAHKLEALKKSNVLCYAIGVIEKEPGLRIKRADEHCEQLIPKGYSHF